jgi:predicted GIY-YIG superfamily endonuclease
MRESRDESNVNRIMKNYYIYILASKKNGTLYIGITGDLIKMDSRLRKTL